MTPRHRFRRVPKAGEGVHLATAGRRKIVGAKRSLERMTHHLRTGANFLENRFTQIDEKTHELWINDVSDVPGFYAGLVGAGAEFIPGWPDRIEVKHREGSACLYELKLTR